MVHFIVFLLKFTLLAVLYYASIYQYAPSDITQGDWLSKISLLLLFARIFGLLVLYRIIKFIFFSKGKDLFIRLLSALFSLPFYALISILIILGLNGYKDDKTNTISWQTNLVYFKDFKLACIAAGIDNSQIREKNYTPQIIFIPGKLCNILANDTITNDTPYSLEISAGGLSVPYVIAIEKL
jgi:hypothetical protein